MINLSEKMRAASEWCVDERGESDQFVRERTALAILAEAEETRFNAELDYSKLILELCVALKIPHTRDRTALIDKVESHVDRRREDNDSPWSDEARAAVAKVEERYGIEVVSIGHHAKWVERCEAAEKRLAEAEGVGWRDIASAPKDGTEVLLFAMGDMGICYWRDDASLKGWTWGLGMQFKRATHWMPLPAAPPQQPTGEGTEK